MLRTGRRQAATSLPSHSLQPLRLVQVVALSTNCEVFHGALGVAALSGQDLSFVAGSLLLIASGRHGTKAGISLEPVASSVTYQNLPLCLSEISES